MRIRFGGHAAINLLLFNYIVKYNNYNDSFIYLEAYYAFAIFQYIFDTADS